MLNFLMNILMTGCKDMGKKLWENGDFPPFVIPKIFLQKSSSVTFVPLWCPNFMQKVEKTNELMKKDGPQTDKGDY